MSVINMQVPFGSFCWNGKRTRSKSRADSAARRWSPARLVEPVLFCLDMYHGISHIALAVSRYTYFVTL